MPGGSSCGSGVLDLGFLLRGELVALGQREAPWRLMGPAGLSHVEELVPLPTTPKLALGCLWHGTAHRCGALPAGASAQQGGEDGEILMVNNLWFGQLRPDLP